MANEDKVLKDSMFNNEEIREKTRIKHVQRLIEMSERYEKNNKGLLNSVRINSRQKDLIQDEIKNVQKQLPKKISILFDKKWEYENTTSPDQKEQEIIAEKWKAVDKEITEYKNSNTAFGKIVQDFEDLHRLHIAHEENIKGELAQKDQNVLKFIAANSLRAVLEGEKEVPVTVESGIDFIVWFLTEFDKLMTHQR